MAAGRGARHAKDKRPRHSHLFPFLQIGDHHVQFEMGQANILTCLSAILIILISPVKSNSPFRDHYLCNKNVNSSIRALIVSGAETRLLSSTFLLRNATSRTANISLGLKSYDAAIDVVTGFWGDSCVTLLEAPAIFDSEDILSFGLQLKERCFGKIIVALTYITFTKTEARKDKYTVMESCCKAYIVNLIGIIFIKLIVIKLELSL